MLVLGVLLHPQFLLGRHLLTQLVLAALPLSSGGLG
jgi:hypothetical protein